MAYWLMKSEPESYSIDDLARQKTGGWDGVRNYAARNFMKTMKKGDLALFYHSSADPSGAAGVMEIVGEYSTDPTQFDPKNHHYDPRSPAAQPRWALVTVRFVEKFPSFVPIGEIKRVPALKNMALLKYSRLSIQPVTPQEWETILAMGRKKS